MVIQPQTLVPFSWLFSLCGQQFLLPYSKTPPWCCLPLKLKPLSPTVSDLDTIYSNIYRALAHSGCLSGAGDSKMKGFLFFKAKSIFAALTSRAHFAVWPFFFVPQIHLLSKSFHCWTTSSLSPTAPGWLLCSIFSSALYKKWHSAQALPVSGGESLSVWRPGWSTCDILEQLGLHNGETLP